MCGLTPTWEFAHAVALAVWLGVDVSWSRCGNGIGVDGWRTWCALRLGSGLRGWMGGIENE